MGDSKGFRATRLSRPVGRMATLPTSPHPPLAEFELFVVGGPDVGKTFPLSGSLVRIGHSDDADIVLSDETVSHAHLSIEETPAGYLVKDLGSTNGTRLNGVPVVEALLLPGADLVLGESTLRFQPRRRVGRPELDDEPEPAR